ncbi:MAG TPA: serine/threonine-protein kinase [Polyangiaceae bacterium]
MSEPARFDGCEVVEQVRAGAVSELYRAVQRPLGRPVLIKSIGASILPSSPFAASLEREARVLAELDHSNIVELYDFVRRDERMWMVLEHVDGWSLEEILKKAKKLPEPAALAIVLEVSRALAHAHEKGIFHRDIQPRNVLVSRRGEVKVTNFSIASDSRLETAPELLDGGASYTGPSYMSPEQILGEPPDPRSDLFSLGVVLYELLAGERPFKAPDERNESLRIRSEPPPPLGRRVSGLSAISERIVMRCLEKLPSDRYQHARDLCSALESACREIGVQSSQDAISRALADAGFVGVEGRIRDRQRSSPLGMRASRMTLTQASAGLFLAFVLLASGIVLIQIVARRGEARAGTEAGRQRLELVPQPAAYLRVVAEPWAHVVVNGQHVDTTPFARSIPLTAGTHYVRFEHPNAPTERRTVQLAPGETVLLNVTLRVSASSGTAGAPPLPVSSAVAEDTSP